MKNLRCKIGKIFNKINIIDKFLMIFMIILLLHSGYNLFFTQKISNEKNVIDIFSRTSAASIFGYFLSGNFVKDNCIRTENESKEPASEDLPPKCDRIKKFQVAVVSIVGLCSLCLLLALRDFGNVTAETTATVSQLRDFVSACVGFLVGSGKE